MRPNIERILVDHLGAADAVQEIVGDRIGTKTPKTLGEPWVRVTYYDDPPAGKSSTDHHIAFYVQCDCYAGKEGTKAQANELAGAVRALIGGNAMAGEHAGAVVTGSKATGSRPLADDTYDPPLDRYIVTGTVWAYGVEEVQ